MLTNVISDLMYFSLIIAASTKLFREEIYRENA